MKLLFCERIFALTKEFSAAVKISDIDFSHVFDFEIETIAINSLREWLNGWIRDHGTTLEEDEAILKEPTTTANRGLVVRLRKAEKGYFTTLLEGLAQQEVLVAAAYKEAMEEEATEGTKGVSGTDDL